MSSFYTHLLDIKNQPIPEPLPRTGTASFFVVRNISISQLSIYPTRQPISHVRIRLVVAGHGLHAYLSHDRHSCMEDFMRYGSLIQPPLV